MLLNLDQNFKPLEGDEILFEKFIFPGGEPHIKIKSHSNLSDPVTITHRINSFNDLGLLCIAVDALRIMQVKIKDLFIPYFPAARQDRVMVPGEPLTLKVYADIINNLHFENVIIYDVHSGVTPTYLNNCVIISNHQFVEQVINLIGNKVLLISPDAGSLKKIYQLSEFLGKMEVIECSKSRDVKNGKLKGFTVNANNLHEMDCLVVDDICDGGATFIGLAKELKHKNAGKLYLAVSHGIFSKGFDELECFDKLFTTNSVKDITHPRLTQLKLNNSLLSH